MENKGGSQMSNKWAIVIGTKGYPGENIAGDNNARLMVRVLKSVYGFESGKIKVLLNEEWSYPNLEVELEWLRANTDESSSVFFFYSGHGYVDPVTLNFNFSTIKYAKLAIVQEGCFSGDCCVPLAAPNRVIIGSTKPGQAGTSLPSKSGFGELFINKGMKQGLGDVDGDGLVSVQDAFNYYTNITHDGTMSDSYPVPLVP